MKSLLSGLVCVLLFLALPARAESGPRRNLWVDIRWVDSSLSNAALSGVREGAVVVGTAGSVSPRGGLGLSTRRESNGSSQLQRLLVLNGSTARVRLSEQLPVQWLDYGLQLETGQALGAKVLALPRSASVEMLSEFSVTPQWPGGRQPVRLSLQVQQGRAPGVAGEPAPPINPATHAQAGQSTQIQSTVLLPLGEWLTIARSGLRAEAQERGMLSSRDAEGRASRELQIRLDLAP
ncbi:hypothetical protein HNP55_001569 [Paucibacter oligotrophus]|uniref:Type II/III secretion system protein n=1 Tax=Roseateles oligotrophus TaxID=1769250 RepID=A0A840L4C2_9BURK|nr:hypothetical protein [Roseateles oligotrophus]MBB4843050.1 hypothetical protein [Roseateles oligotrophus]